MGCCRHSIPWHGLSVRILPRASVESEQGGTSMIYEWRTYEAMPGKLLALNIHLEVAAGLFKKHGLGVLGFWTEEIGTGGQITYMWIYSDLEDRQKKLAAFGADVAWQQQVAEETAKEGVIVARIHNTMLQRTP